MRKVFLDDLARWESGSNKGNINWKQSSEEKSIVKFQYDDIEGEVKIADYDNKTQYLYIKYKDKENLKIKTNSFSRCELGRLIGVYDDFKFSIGQNIKNEYKDIIILDRKYVKNKYKKNIKYYKYSCNVCGFDGGEHYKNVKYNEELWVIESSIQQEKISCPCCKNKITVEGINDIPTTCPEIVYFFVGGYQEAKIYTKSSNFKINPICPICGTIKDLKMPISQIYERKSIACCGDGMKYPEKLVLAMLRNLGIDCQPQLTKTTFKWCSKYRYDFYIPSLNCIIETHGMQHYGHGFGNNKGRTLEEEQENDRLKEGLSLENGIKKENYIVIDCRKSELKWIKGSIINSELAKLLDLNKVDWSKCQKFACESLVKEVCDLKKNNPKLTPSEIGKIVGFSSCNVRRWLFKGNACGLCEYDSNKEQYESNKRNNQVKSKPVEIFKNGTSLGAFCSMLDLEKQSEKLFETKLSHSSISRVCLSKAKSHKGFTFKYIDNK
ncbi:hypothetical protein KTC96_14230 [Clostridium estertheticum]|uniref:hypothetical protein n=1 Tax=Clostridium estertheticum TaxID=238834 RepID=UPI001C7D11AC|nr:hypothetical protein [Clostridium estertheticum]MBX4258847.1 hypothetical protein [Clostridium estertheticum]WLC69147.1 hypothetical protein KTC96_14230 [Clostridium estertheticum]